MTSAGITIETPDEEINLATALAVRTLYHNVSGKWGTLCPTVAPAWGSSYPAWVHPYDNFWMNKVTPYPFPKEQVAWPVILFSKYQAPSGMIGWGVHDCESPELTQAQMAQWSPDQINLPGGGQIAYEEGKTGSERVLKIAAEGERVIHLFLALEHPPTAVTLNERPAEFQMHQEKNRHIMDISWTAANESAVRVR